MVKTRSELVQKGTPVMGTAFIPQISTRHLQHRTTRTALEAIYFDNKHQYSAHKAEVRRKEILANIAAIKASMCKVAMTIQHKKENKVYSSYEEYSANAPVKTQVWVGMAKQAIKVLDLSGKVIDRIYNN